MTKVPCYIWDIDGTLACNAHRQPLLVTCDQKPCHGAKCFEGPNGTNGCGFWKPNEKPDWDAFFDALPDDVPYPEMADLFETIHGAGVAPIAVFATGRPDSHIVETIEWLRDHITDEAGLLYPLYMRRAGDHRSDKVTKKEMLQRIKADGYEPVLVFDDRDHVVNMWRQEGLRCLQVAKTTF